MLIFFKPVNAKIITKRDCIVKKNAQSKARAAEWFAALFCVWDGWSWVRALKLYQCLWTHVQVCGLKRLGHHADICMVSRCHTRGESEDHSSEKAHKGSTLALKPRADVTRSPKQGYQWPHEKDLCPPKTSRILLVLQLLLPFTNSHLTTAFTAQI